MYSLHTTSEEQHCGYFNNVACMCVQACDTPIHGVLGSCAEVVKNQSQIEFGGCNR